MKVHFVSIAGPFWGHLERFGWGRLARFCVGRDRWGLGFCVVVQLFGDGDGSDGLRRLVFLAGSVEANGAKIVSVEGYRMRS